MILKNGRILSVVPTNSKGYLKLEKVYREISFGYGFFQASSSKEANGIVCFRIYASLSSDELVQLWTKCIDAPKEKSGRDINFQKVSLPRQTERLIFETFSNNIRGNQLVFWSNISLLP